MNGAGKACATHPNAPTPSDNVLRWLGALLRLFFSSNSFTAPIAAEIGVISSANLVSSGLVVLLAVSKNARVAVTTFSNN